MTPKTLLAGLILLMPCMASAQLRMIAQYMNARENGGNLGPFQRYDVGYSLPVASATWTIPGRCFKTMAA